jgi:predicted transcriptional regulator
VTKKEIEEFFAKLPRGVWFTVKEVVERSGMQDQLVRSHMNSLLGAGLVTRRSINDASGEEYPWQGGTRYLYWVAAENMSGELLLDENEEKFIKKAREIQARERSTTKTSLALQILKSLPRGKWMTMAEIMETSGTERSRAYPRVKELISSGLARERAIPRLKSKRSDIVIGSWDKHPRSLYLVLPDGPADEQEIAQRFLEKLEWLRENGQFRTIIDGERRDGEPYWTQYMRCRYCGYPLGCRPTFIDRQPYHSNCAETKRKMIESKALWPKHGIMVHANPYSGGTAVYITHQTGFSSERLEELHDHGGWRWQSIEELRQMIDAPEDWGYGSSEEVLRELNDIIFKWKSTAEKNDLPFHIDRMLLDLLGVEVVSNPDGIIKLVKK